MADQWIVVPKWDRFQHYKDRWPTFIKNYVELLHDDNYRSLTAHQRAVLHGLWLIYAASHGQVPVNTASLSAQLGLRVSSRQLEALNHAGFIDLVASKPLALARARETETEKTETVGPRTAVVRGPARARGKPRRRTPLSDDLKHELDKLVPRLTDVDAKSRAVLEREAAGLSLAQVATVRETITRNGKRVGVGYAVNALRQQRRQARGPPSAQ